MASKKPRKSVTVAPFSKTPRGGELAEVVRNKPFCWRLGDIGWDGPWGWSRASVDDLIRTVIPKPHDYESMTWSEMDGPSGSHPVQFEDLCAEARARLDDLGREVESLFSVRPASAGSGG
jgi:hypothetical protein